MNDEIRGFVFCLDGLDEVIQYKEYIENLGYKLIVIKHFEEVIDAQSNAIMRGEVDVPVIFFINSSVFLKAWDNDQVRLRHLKRKYIGVILVFEGEVQLADRMHDVLIDELQLPVNMGRIKRLLRNAEKRMHLEIEKSKLKRELGFRLAQMREMQKVGISLSIERDVNKLMGSILSKARQLTSADAGSMFLVDRKNPNKLRFVKAQNDSLDVPFEETEMNLDKTTIAGCCVLNGEMINIEDAYELERDSSFKHSPNWDNSVGYRTKSILCIPMKKVDGETIGCIQLINRKVNKNIILQNPKVDVEKHVIPFDSDNQSMIWSFASQAAVAIENSNLLEDIENLIEGLVRASVLAIESRDPVTSGHSERVAKYSLRLAHAVHADTEGLYKDVHFSVDNMRVLKYASLLHDFGKVGVREEILRKEKKLFPAELDNLGWKIELSKRIKELAIFSETIKKHMTGENPLDKAALSAIEMNVMKGQIECNKLFEKIHEAALPLPKNDTLIQEIKKYLKQTIPLSNGTRIPLVSNDEFAKLSINYGSLTDAEREEIEAHVIHTFNFLKEIPWTKDLRDIPKVAGSHHERNNGAGYPEGLIVSEIPLASKIMAVADVFDSLIAWDRPYKDSLPIEDALSILQEEVDRNKLDGELVKLFIENKLYETPEIEPDIYIEEMYFDNIEDEEDSEILTVESSDGNEEPADEPIEDVVEIQIEETEEEEFEAEQEIEVEHEPETQPVVSKEKQTDQFPRDFYNYSPFDETRTSLPQDFVELENRRLAIKREEETERRKAQRRREQEEDLEEETNLILEKPIFAANTPLEDNTDNVYKQLEQELANKKKLSPRDSKVLEIKKNLEAKKKRNQKKKEESRKYEFLDETSIHADLGSKAELSNFLDQIQEELNEKVPEEQTEIKKNKSTVKSLADVVSDAEYEKQKIETISEVLNDVDPEDDSETFDDAFDLDD